MTISQGRTALYRLYGKEGKLLYIGISQNPDVRWGQHSTTKPWWGEVEERKIEWHRAGGPGPCRPRQPSGERRAALGNFTKPNQEEAARRQSGPTV